MYIIFTSCGDWKGKSCHPWLFILRPQVGQSMHSSALSTWYVVLVGNFPMYSLTRPFFSVNFGGRIHYFISDTCGWQCRHIQWLYAGVVSPILRRMEDKMQMEAINAKPEKSMEKGDNFASARMLACHNYNLKKGTSWQGLAKARNWNLAGDWIWPKCNI